MTRFLLILTLLCLPGTGWAVTIKLELTGEVTAPDAFHSRSRFAAGDRITAVALLESGPAELAAGSEFFWDGIAGSETQLTVSSATGAYEDITATSGPIRLFFPPDSSTGARAVGFSLGERHRLEARLYHPGPFLPETWDETASVMSFGSGGTPRFFATLFLTGSGFPASNDWGICFTICILRSEWTELKVTPELEATPSAVPLPATAPLLAGALALLAGWVRHRTDAGNCL